MAIAHHAMDLFADTLHLSSRGGHGALLSAAARRSGPGLFGEGAHGRTDPSRFQWRAAAGAMTWSWPIYCRSSGWTCKGSQMSTVWRAIQNKTANSYVIEITL